MILASVNHSTRKARSISVLAQWLVFSKQRLKVKFDFKRNHQMNVLNDIHICGSCQKQFDDLSFFLNHKKQCLLQSEQTLYAVNKDTSLVEDNELFLNETLLDLSVIENGSLPIFLQCYNEEIVTDNDNDERELDEINSNKNVTPIYTDLYKTIDKLDEIENTQDQLTDKGSKIQIDFKSDIPAPLNKKPRHVCDICNHEERYPRDLKRHMRTHTGERPFTCPYCEKTFARKDKLTCHERIHTDDRRYKCDACDYSTANGSALWSHKRTHSGDRPHRCQLCNYQARSTSHLALHLRTHTGDRPFFCKIKSCGRAFKTSMDLNRHSLSHRLAMSDHCTTVDGFRYIKKGPKVKNRTRIRCTKAHECQFCGAAFVRADSLRSHVKLHS